MNTQDASVRPSHELIGSAAVEGTPVYDAAGQHVGIIERLMLEKHTGKVAFAVLSFGGFLGLGDHHYPLPWSKLSYDDGLGGYRIDLTREQIEGAPRFRPEEEFDWSRSIGVGVFDYYGVPPYWI